TAAGLKGYQLATEPLLGTGFLDSRWLLTMTVEFELLFGLWLLANLWPKLSWAAAMGCFSLFTCVSFYKALSGYPTCGCFGRLPVNPWWTATLDLVVIFSLLRWQPKGEDALFAIRLGQLRLRAVGVLAVWLFIAVPTAIAIGRYTDTTLSEAGEIVGDGKIVILKPETWVGKRFPLLDYINIGDRLKEGTWLVLLYHHDCPDCCKAIKNLPHEALPMGDEMRVALVEVPPYGETSQISAFPGADFTGGRLSDTHGWFVTTPVKSWLKSGQVLAVVATRESTNGKER
ncbi:MAG: MauE/DoxX family redox-associated membrane protein, partial [Limisphaerales bacterium]